MKHLAERRTDIFGVGEEAAQEAAIGKKMGEEETRRGPEPEKVSFILNSKDLRIENIFFLFFFFKF